MKCSSSPCAVHICVGSTSEICTVQGPFTWVAHYIGLSCYKHAQGPFLMDRDMREDRLIINQSGSDTYSTLGFHRLIKTPMYSLDAKWIHRALPCKSGAQFICMWKSDNMTTTHDTGTVIVMAGNVKVTRQKRGSVIKEKKQVLTEERESQLIISLIIGIISFKEE